jgi:hypothetical protein
MLPPLQKTSGAKDAYKSMKPRQANGLFTRMGHADISTTQIYLHVMKKPGLGVRSPFDAFRTDPTGPGNL